MARKKRVLFLCTGNSARSQMAEGFARAKGSDALAASSGGVSPKGIHPLTPQVMAERDVDISAQTSKGFHPADAAGADLVITLCGNARDRCPVLPAGVDKRHWPLADPAAAPPESALAEFRRVRDEVEARVSDLVDEIRRQAAAGAGS
ncbi:MAG: arsenate reductase ArsC [Myxococcota bacterium]